MTESPRHVHPVIVGGDIGAYALARAFHQEYGARSTVLVSVAPLSFTRSRIADLVLDPKITDPDVLVSRLQQIAAEYPHDALLLLTNADWFVATLIARRAELEPHYLMPFCTSAVFDMVSDKEAFAAVCERLSIRTPTTVAVHVPTMGPVSELPVELRYPLVGKPASSTDYHYVHFPGKAKVHYFDTRQDLETVLTALQEANYQGTFLVQEFIPGGETQMGSLTAYRDSRGAVTMLATGQVLLQEHTPDALGIPAAIVTTFFADAAADAARFLDDVGYHGFANFDFKIDPRDDKCTFFEMNPRIGRNNYYVTAAGLNPARFVVADLVEHRSIPLVVCGREVVYSVVPLPLLLRYLPQPGMRRHVLRLIAARRTAHPLMYWADRNPKRVALITASTYNHVRKYHRHYPAVTDTGR